VSNRLPNFFIIGAAKSGTTSLHEYLAQHPEVYMSFQKELNFFSFLDSIPSFSGPVCDHGNPVLCDRLRREKYGHSITTWSDYRKAFSRVRSEKAIGESSVSYLYFPHASERIRHSVPDARLIAILRNPIDRAYSKYRQLRRDDAEPLISFEQALTAEAARMQENWSPAWFYIDRGFYYRQLKRYYKLFGRRHIHIILYEDFESNPEEIMKAIFDFLGVDTRFRPDMSHKYNVSKERTVPRNIYLYNFITRPNWFSNLVRERFTAKSLSRIKPIARKAVARDECNGEAASMTDNTRQMLRRIFYTDIHQLQNLIGRDLSSWL
jgi:hypothetical protein